MGVKDFDGPQDLEDKLSLRRSHDWYQPRGMNDPVKVDVPQSTDTPWLKFFYYVGFPVGAFTLMTGTGAVAMGEFIHWSNEMLNYFDSEVARSSVEEAKLLGGALGAIIGYERISNKWFTPENKKLYISKD